MYVYIVRVGMGEIFCDSNEVYLDEYIDVSEYYIYDGVTGRMTSKYVERDGEIVEVDDPGETLFCTVHA